MKYLGDIFQRSDDITHNLHHVETSDTYTCYRAPFYLTIHQTYYTKACQLTLPDILLMTVLFVNVCNYALKGPGVCISIKLFTTKH